MVFGNGLNVMGWSDLGPTQPNKYQTLMQDLRRQEEERAYESMLRQPAHQNVKSVPGPSAMSSMTTVEDDEVTYSDVNRQMALIFNVIISIVACSYAIWMAARHWSTPQRLALSLGGSGLVAIAEVVVYAGYLRKIQEAKQRGKQQVETREIINTWVIGGRKLPNEARNNEPNKDIEQTIGNPSSRNTSLRYRPRVDDARRPGKDL